MQFEPPMQNHRFDHYRTMNSDSFTFPEELFSVNSRNSFQSDHTAHIAIPIILREAEPSQPLSSPTYRPTSRDIICGRGRGSFLHEGNKVYLALAPKEHQCLHGRKKTQPKEQHHQLHRIFLEGERIPIPQARGQQARMAWAHKDRMLRTHRPRHPRFDPQAKRRNKSQKVRFKIVNAIRQWL